MKTITTIVLLALALLSTPRAARASAPTFAGGLDLAGDARPLSAAYDEAHALLLIGTYSLPTRCELYAIAFDANGKTPRIAWSTNVDGNVNEIVTDGVYAYLATTVKDSELVVVDLSTGVVAGRFDAPGAANAIHVALTDDDTIILDRKLSEQPDHYELDVSSPAAIKVLSSKKNKAETVWPSAQAVSMHYAYPGFLVDEFQVTTARGTVYYGVVRGAPYDLYVIEATQPVAFNDVNGDGIYRLGCVGDSNTADRAYPQRSWCQDLPGLINDQQFAVVNVAVVGATAVSPNLYPTVTSTVASQMPDVLALQPDALVLAFGTNDYFQGRTPMAIVGALEDQAEVAAAAGIEVWVASTPPLVQCMPDCPYVAAINDAVIAAFGDHVIDFFDGFVPDDYNADGFHFNNTGELLRAQLVLDAIGNPALR